jgi:membrane-bound lytic murein transglycosylase D
MKAIGARSQVDPTIVRARRQFQAEQVPCQERRDGSSDGRRPRLAGAALLVLALAVAGCGGTAANRHSSAPTDVRRASTDASETGAPGDSLEPAAEPDYSGLEKVAPEIVGLETLYREALQAVWNDDLATAEARSAALDSALAEVDDDDPNQLVSIYIQSLETRMEKLKDLILEQRTLQTYLAKMDSLSVISPEGVVDSTALSTLLERRVEAPPSSPRFDFELVENPLTQRWVNFFTGDGRHYMELWLTRLPIYRDLIDDILDEYNLPRDLVFLAMIESGLSVKAHSSANAVGPWQFIAGTGRIYDLRIDWWVDDRRNIEKATRAASSHLSDLYDEFGSWPLAFAAYNAGPRRITRAIAKHRTRDFWKLTSLPSQTRNYVPKFMAALYIGKDPERYGFRVPDGDKFAYDIVVVEDATDLRLIAELCECSLEDLIELNPYVRRWCTPPGESYDVRVPPARVPRSPSVGAGAGRGTHHLAPPPRSKGETLVGVARNYSTSVQAICDANKLRPKSSLRPGNYLIIPGDLGRRGQPARRALHRRSRQVGVERVGDGSGRRTYVVRRGDTLSSIGRRHSVFRVAAHEVESQALGTHPRRRAPARSGPRPGRLIAKNLGCSLTAKPRRRLSKLHTTTGSGPSFRVENSRRSSVFGFEFRLGNAAFGRIGKFGPDRIFTTRCLGASTRLFGASTRFLGRALASSAHRVLGVRRSQRGAVGQRPRCEIVRARHHADQTVRADALMGWKPRVLADDGDAVGEHLGLLFVHPAVIGDADDRRGADPHPFVEDAAVHDGVAPHQAIVHQHRVAHQGSRLDDDAGTEHRALDATGDLTAVGDHRVVHLGASLETSRRAVVLAGQDVPLGIEEIERRRIFHQSMLAA